MAPRFPITSISDVMGPIHPRGGDKSGSTVGVDVISGDGSTGSKEAFDKTLKACQGHFYLFKDASDVIVEGPGDIHKSAGLFVRSLLPMRQAAYAGITSLVAADAPPGFPTNCLRILGMIGGLLTPTINVRIDPKDPLMEKMEIDDYFKQTAYKTKATIAPEYMGLEGIIQQGFKSDWKEKFELDRKKSIIGMVRLINPIGIAVVIYALARVALAKLA